MLPIPSTHSTRMTPPMIIPLVQNETLKILRRKRFAVVAAILFAIIALVTYSQYRRLREQRNRNWRAEIQQQVEEARQKLRDDGGRRFLLRQLRRRFGELPPATVARVEAAEPEVLEGWGDLVLTARSLDEVLGGG